MTPGGSNLRCGAGPIWWVGKSGGPPPSILHPPECASGICIMANFRPRGGCQPRPFSVFSTSFFSLLQLQGGPKWGLFEPEH